MTNEKEFRKELLKANGIWWDDISEEDKQALRLVLKRDRGRALRMKRATIATWVAVLCAIGLGAVLLLLPRGAEYAIAFVYGLFYVAVVCTILYVTRVRTSRNRELDLHRAEVEARLAKMEEVLERLVEKE
jgi:hypothetical protein